MPPYARTLGLLLLLKAVACESATQCNAVVNYTLACMCGMALETTHGFARSTCVATRAACGPFEAGVGNLSLIGENFEGECLVADLTDPDRGFGACNNTHVELAPSDSCLSNFTIGKVGELCLVLLTFLLVEIFLTRLALGSPSQMTYGLLYWFNDFWAGLAAWQCAAVRITSGMEEGYEQFVVCTFAAMLIELFVYDGPLLFVKKNRSMFVIVSSTLGTLTGIVSIPCAYWLKTIALMGPCCGCPQWSSSRRYRSSSTSGCTARTN